MLITNDFFKGYFQALNSVEATLDHKIENSDKYLSHDELNLCKELKNTVQDLRKSYQDLVTELNKKHKENNKT